MLAVYQMDPIKGQTRKSRVLAAVFSSSAYINESVGTFKSDKLLRNIQMEMCECGDLFLLLLHWPLSRTKETIDNYSENNQQGIYIYKWKEDNTYTRCIVLYIDDRRFFYFIFSLSMYIMLE